jgi:hypothetical protein
MWNPVACRFPSSTPNAHTQILISQRPKTFKLSKCCSQAWHFVQEQAIDFVCGQENWTLVPINCVKQFFFYLFLNGE